MIEFGKTRAVSDSDLRENQVMDLSKADKVSGIPGPIAGWGSGVMDTDTTGTMGGGGQNPNLSPEQFGLADGPLGSYSVPSCTGGSGYGLGSGGLGAYGMGVDTGTL